MNYQERFSVPFEYIFVFRSHRSPRATVKHVLYRSDWHLLWWRMKSPASLGSSHNNKPALHTDGCNHLLFPINETTPHFMAYWTEQHGLWIKLRVHSWDRLHWAASAHTERSAVHSSVCHVDSSSAAAMLTSRGCSPVMSPDGGYVGTCPPISIASSLPPYSSSPSVPTCRLSVRQLQVPPCMAGLQLCRQPAQHLCVLWERRGGMSRWSPQLLPALNTATGRQFCGQDGFPLYNNHSTYRGSSGHPVGFCHFL